MKIDRTFNDIKMLISIKSEDVMRFRLYQMELNFNNFSFHWPSQIHDRI